MYGAHLTIVELGEKAWAAREKAIRARRVAKQSTGNAGNAFEREATEFEAKAELLEGLVESLRLRL
jgi:hypothetical protein